MRHWGPYIFFFDIIGPTLGPKISHFLGQRIDPYIEAIHCLLVQLQKSKTSGDIETRLQLQSTVNDQGQFEIMCNKKLV